MANDLYDGIVTWRNSINSRQSAYKGKSATQLMNILFAECAYKGK